MHPRTAHCRGHPQCGAHTAPHSTLTPCQHTQQAATAHGVAQSKYKFFRCLRTVPLHTHTHSALAQHSTRHKTNCASLARASAPRRLLVHAALQWRMAHCLPHQQHPGQTPQHYLARSRHALPAHLFSSLLSAHLPTRQLLLCLPLRPLLLLRHAGALHAGGLFRPAS